MNKPMSVADFCGQIYYLLDKCIDEQKYSKENSEEFNLGAVDGIKEAKTSIECLEHWFIGKPEVQEMWHDAWKGFSEDNAEKQKEDKQ